MGLDNFGQLSFENFMRVVSPLEPAYIHAEISYIAFADASGNFRLHHGRLFLNPETSNRPEFRFRTERVQGGRFPLRTLETGIRDLTEELLNGRLSVPDGTLLFPAAGSFHSVEYVPFHPVGLQSQRRLMTCRIWGAGGPYEYFIQPDLDWEMKAAPTPYDGVQELAHELDLDIINPDTCWFEIVAPNVAVVDARTSKVKAGIAEIDILLARALDFEQVTVGFRVFSQGRIVERSSISGEKLNWEEGTADLKRATHSLQLPTGAVVNAIVSYDGIAQSHSWISDPETVQNPRRAAYEAFDPQLVVMRELVEKAKGKGQQAKDFEAIVSWLFWMLGFSVTQLGNTARTTDAADIIAITPLGKFAIVECTTGLLGADKKMALIHERAQMVRRRLDASSFQTTPVLPIMVTSKPRADVQPDIEQAERLGIFVLTRESIAEAMDRTLVLPNTDQIYLEAQQAVEAAQARALSKNQVQAGESGNKFPLS